MSSVTRSSFLLLMRIIVVNYFSAIVASVVERINVPFVVRNGTGPIELFCTYKIDENENGLVIKWYHELDQIYQWIPPLPPQNTGVIKDYAEYPAENLKQPKSHSIIHLKMVTFEMSGIYMCIIKTFRSEHTRAAKMIVYVPESSAEINVSRFNDTHINVKCTTFGARPRPILVIYIEGIKVDDRSDVLSRTDRYSHDLSVARNVVLRDMMDPVVIECEIDIPETNYKRRERMVYYPDYIKLRQ